MVTTGIPRLWLGMTTSKITRWTDSLLLVNKYPALRLGIFLEEEGFSSLVFRACGLRFGFYGLRDVVIYSLLQGLFGHISDDLLFDHSILENEQSRNATDSVALRRGGARMHG